MAHLVVVTVGTTPTQLCQVPPGGTVTIQNVGTKPVTVAEGVEPSVGKGLVLAKAPAVGTPGGSLTTYPPGDPTRQTWYGVVATGTSTVAVLVVGEVA